MFDEKIIAEYKDIKAPTELYDKIMNAEVPEVKKSNVVPFGRIASMAAAFALILVAGFVLFGGSNLPDVYLGTEKLSGEVSVTEKSNDGLVLARTLNEISCELTFDIHRETTVVLSEGKLVDINGNIILEAKNEEVFTEKFSCNWVIPIADESITYEIKLSDKNGTYFIKLYFDRQEDIWTACLKR